MNELDNVWCSVGIPISFHPMSFVLLEQKKNKKRNQILNINMLVSSGKRIVCANLCQFLVNNFIFLSVIIIFYWFINHLVSLLNLIIGIHELNMNSEKKTIIMSFVG